MLPAGGLCGRLRPAALRQAGGVLPLHGLLSYTRGRRGVATLCDYGRQVLTSSAPEEKVRLTREAHERWHTRVVTALGDLAPPDQPARPPTPELREKREMPGARELNVPLPIYLLHSLAHIELNAVDLGWDLILRFRHENLPDDFYTDWVAVLSDEARHFGLLSARLDALGYHYGSLPAHDSLLRDGETTGHDLKARLAIIALVHETHGLDSWERLVQRFYSSADKESGRIVDTICREEIDHVRKGLKWFRFLCERDNEDPETAFQAIVHRTQIPVCGPFNKEARNLAGMPDHWYEPLQRMRKHPPRVKKHQHRPSDPARQKEEQSAQQG